MGLESAVYSRYMVNNGFGVCCMCTTGICLNNGFGVCCVGVYSRYIVKQWVWSKLCTPGIGLKSGSGVLCVCSNSGFEVCCKLKVYVLTMVLEKVVNFWYRFRKWVRSLYSCALQV